MNIRNNTANGRFETEASSAAGDTELAYLEYRLHDGKIALMHTWVPEAIEGRGIAGALALYAFEYAKKEGLPVLVYCPYVKVWLERHPEWKPSVHQVEY